MEEITGFFSRKDVGCREHEWKTLFSKDIEHKEKESGD